MQEWPALSLGACQQLTAVLESLVDLAQEDVHRLRIALKGLILPWFDNASLAIAAQEQALGVVPRNEAWTSFPELQLRCQEARVKLDCFMEGLIYDTGSFTPQLRVKSRRMLFGARGLRIFGAENCQLLCRGLLLGPVSVKLQRCSFNHGTATPQMSQSVAVRSLRKTLPTSKKIFLRLRADARAARKRLCSSTRDGASPRHRGKRSRG
jgi:hypothetical protein